MIDIELKSYHGKKGDYEVIKINEKKLDASIGPELKKEIVKYFIEPSEKDICLDLNYCGFIDFSGLSSILVFNRVSKSKNKKPYVLLKEGGTIETKIKINGLDDLNIVHSLDEL